MGVSRQLARLAAGLALSISPVAASAKDGPLVMAPASAWVLDRAEDSCAVRRVFKGGEDEVLLELRQFGPEQGFQVTLVSNTLTRTGTEPRVRFDPDDDFHWPAAYFFEGDTAQGVLYSDSLRPNAMKTLRVQPEWPEAEREARELAITDLTVAGTFERDIKLQTGRMFAPMADLRDCTDVLLERWGMDADIYRTASRKAEPVGMSGWVRRIQENYPKEHLDAMRSGMAMIRLIVGPNGKPTSCITNKDAPDHAFDEQACDIVMRYARFEPALDANGVPTEDFWSTKIYYQIVR